METDLSDVTHVVLSGGGLSGFMYLGLLARLPKASLRHISGTSIGAFFGFLLCIGADMNEVREYIIQLLNTTPDLLEIPVQNLFDFTQHLGFLSLDPLIGILEHFSEKILKTRNPRFADLAITPKFTITATELLSATCHYFSQENSPEVHVLDAVRASMTIPFVSPPVQIPECPDCLYIDGFLTDNFPVAPFADEEVPRSLGVAILNKSHGRPPRTHTPTLAMPTFAEYAYLVLYATRDALFSSRKWKKQVTDYLCIENPPIGCIPIDLRSLSIQITPEDIQKSYHFGWNSLENLTPLSKSPPSPPPNELSSDPDS